MNQGATTEVFAPPAEQPPCKVIPPVDGLLTKRQLAETLQVHPRTVTRKVTEGVIPVIRIGSAVRFRLSDVLHALQDQGDYMSLETTYGADNVKEMLVTGWKCAAYLRVPLAKFREYMKEHHIPAYPINSYDVRFRWSEVYEILLFASVWLVPEDLRQDVNFCEAQRIERVRGLASKTMPAKEC